MPTFKILSNPLPENSFPSPVADPACGGGRDEACPPARQGVFASVQNKNNRLNCSLAVLALAVILWLMGCAGTTYVSPEPGPVAQKET